MTIGNKQTATMLYKHFDGDPFTGKRSPNGFRRIGEGAYRTAILEKSTETVYKVGSSWANETEAKVAARLRKKSMRKLGLNLVIPVTTKFIVGKNAFNENLVVIGQEFAKNAKGTFCESITKVLYGENEWNRGRKCTCSQQNYGLCFAQALKRIMEWSNVDDIHALNVLVDNAGTFWLIDMGDDVE